MEQKCYVGNRTPDTIKELDEHGHENEADDAGNETHLDGVATQIRTDCAFFNNCQRSWQGASAQKRRKNNTILNRKTAADLAVATRNRFANDRGAQYLAIEHDCKRTVDVLGRDISELTHQGCRNGMTRLVRWCADRSQRAHQSGVHRRGRSDLQSGI